MLYKLKIKKTLWLNFIFFMNDLYYQIIYEHFTSIIKNLIN